MQQETMRMENSEEMLPLGNTVSETFEPLPFGRLEIIFTMVGVLCVVFLSMLDQTISLMAMTFSILQS